MNKNIIFAILILVFIPFVFSQDLSFNFKQDQAADVKVTCQLNGTYCPSNTICHITAYYPNSSIMVDNQQMSYQTSYFNYTIESTKVNTLGIYRASASCNYTGSIFNIGTFYFGVVKKDVQVNDADFLSEGRIMVILSVLAVLFFFLWLIFYIKHKPIHYLFLFLSIIFVDSLIYFSYLIGDTTNSAYSGVLFKLFIVMLVVTFLLVVVMMIDITLKVVAYVENVRNNKHKQMWGELPISNK